MPPRTGETAGLVLAGGQSRRMGGGDKFLAELAGETLIARTVRRLAAQVAKTAISANCNPALLAGLNLPVLPDAPPSRGPLSGIQAGLAWAQAEGCSHIVTAASDTPFFPPDLVARLAAAATSRDAIVLAASGATGAGWELCAGGTCLELGAEAGQPVIVRAGCAEPAQ